MAHSEHSELIYAFDDRAIYYTCFGLDINIFNDLQQL